jgi:mRNA interferase MazF
MISRGQIYFVTLDPVQGREQAGSRPVLVVSDDAINSLPLVVTVVVGTNAANITRSYPTNVLITAKESGLPQDTVFLCFQLRSLDPKRFIDLKTNKTTPAGIVPLSKLQAIDTALRSVLSLHQ